MQLIGSRDLPQRAAAGRADRPVVRQRTGDDCMLCALAMFGGRTWEEAAEAAIEVSPGFDPGSFMPHAVMRRIAHAWGLTLLSSIYMDWRFPGIIGVVSLTQENCGHALYWDGQRLIDPGISGLYDLAYARSSAIEFTQRAGDLSILVALDGGFEPATPAVCLEEYF